MKPGTFTQLFTHLIFAVKNRECLLKREQRITIFSYVSGIVSNLNHKAIIVNGYSDHIHIFFGQNPSISISETVTVTKKSSSSFINENKWFPGKFQWQDGYAALSYSRSQIENVYRYIASQENHHKINNFRSEYIDFLKKAQIEFDEKYLFDFFD